MGEAVAIWGLLGAIILATVLAALVALATAPPAAVQAQMWQQVRVATVGQFWHAFQAEVMTELGRAPQLPPPAVRAPDPTSAVPPLYLYHGTRRSNLASIFARGIEGRSGGWAFAAGDYETARQYGQRWGGDYVVFRILAQQAYQNGAHFEGRGGYFVSRHIHPTHIDFHWTLADYAHRQGAAA